MQPPQVAPAKNPSLPVVVHVLAEYVFCPRAGLLAQEESEDDLGEENWPRIPRLDYLPDFDRLPIEQTLEAKWRGLWMTLTWIPVALFMGWCFHRYVSPMPTLLVVGACVFTALRVVKHMREIFVLVTRLHASRTAQPAIPDPHLEIPQPVNWWSLLNAGFASVEYEGPHKDDKLALAGRPWCVLHRGGLRIPVFRKIAGEPKLHHQHFVRMAAYCHLLTVTEGGDSPYSVVLFGRGYDGVAVPNLEKYQREVPVRLDRLREMLSAVRDCRGMPEAPHDNRCRGCHWGKPQRSTLSTLAGTQRIKRTRGNDGRIYHCDCGDRFDWVPGHELAEKLGLKAGE